MERDANQDQSLRWKLDELLHKQETYWAQRAKLKWLKLGYRDTCYFHVVATIRNRKKRISFFKSEGGKIIFSHEEMKAGVLSHFYKLFRKTGRNGNGFLNSFDEGENWVYPQHFDVLSSISLRLPEDEKQAL